MKFKKAWFLFIILPFLLIAVHSFALDTDLYVGGSSAVVKPNLMIIIDRSGSMMNRLTSKYCAYDPSFSYPQPTDKPEINPTTVYKKGSDWFPLNVYKTSVSSIPCSPARTTLTSYNKGLYTGKPDNSSCTSPSTSASYATGNYLRFLFADQDNKDTCDTKWNIAKKVVRNLLEEIDGVNVGLMTFNDYKSYPDNRYGGYYDSQWNVWHVQEGGYVVSPIKDIDVPANRTALIQALDNMTCSDGFTPLAETLYEAGLYFKGGRSYFNSPPLPGKTTETFYVSPIDYWCQKNFVAFMTDGISTLDENIILQTVVRDQDGDKREPIGAVNDPQYPKMGTDYLDDVAKYLYDNDLLPDNPTDPKTMGKQNVITFTIGFALDESEGVELGAKAKDLLRRTANHGHGKFYTTNNVAGLADAFSSVFNEVLTVNSSFVAPIIPVNRLERTTAGDYIYLAFFRPRSGGMWSGNIKKYQVAKVNDPLKGIVVGDILDANGLKAIGSDGKFYPSTKSFWTTSSSDGGEVEQGGVGEILKNRDFTSNPRKIYSNIPGCSLNLTDSCNAFTTTNSSLTTTLLGVSSADARTALIDFIRGIDSYDDNLNGLKTDKRDWLLGSFLHSRPALIFYKDRAVIYAGSNDGMLHAFDEETGEELWAYIPSIFLGNLKSLHTDYPPIFVDGSPAAYVSYDSDGVTVNKAILIFGLRRGGYRYIALDVTDPLKPKYAWHINGDVTGYEEMGRTGFPQAQTWSTPQIGRVKVGGTEKWVAFIGGGYDEGQDTTNPPADDSGRAVYVVDVLDGSLVKRFSRAEYPTMTYCIPGDIAKVDLQGDGYVDRLYVGDMGGRMWRIGPDNPTVDPADVTQWKAKIIFHANSESTEKRKIFHPPDVTFERQDGIDYEMLFFGTGNREDPKGLIDVNRLYAVKDKNSGPVSTWIDLAESDLVDVTEDLLQESSSSEETKEQIRSDLRTKYGWYIKLVRNPGEKVLASPVVYAKTAYYTTFAPTQGEVADECETGEGRAILYALKYDTGEAALNLDLTNDVGGTPVLRKTDREKQIGTAIPSGVVMTVIGGRVTGYAGVGGGVHRAQLGTAKSIFPLTWKLIF